MVTEEKAIRKYIAENYTSEQIIKFKDLSSFIEHVREDVDDDYSEEKFDDYIPIFEKVWKQDYLLKIAKMIAEREIETAINNSDSIKILETIYYDGIKGLKEMSFQELKEEIHFSECFDEISEEYKEES